MNNVSEKQLEANRVNAQKGGVKTIEGKHVVRFNARKHGILGDLVTEYEGDFYNNYLEQLFDELAPATVIENMLVERIALLYLKLFRLTKAEAEFIKSCLNPSTTLADFSFEITKEGYIPAINQNHMRQLLEIYCRYETATENRLYKAINELRKIRQSH